MGFSPAVLSTALGSCPAQFGPSSEPITPAARKSTKFQIGRTIGNPIL